MSSLVCKKFQDLNVTVYGTYDKPLFKAKEIGDLLGISRVRDTVSKMDDNFKVLKGAGTTGGLQDTWFLTEHGLYELLFISRKPIAKTFRGWVSDIIVEIRKTGEYKLTNQTKMIAKNDYIMDQFDKKPVVYIGFVDDHIIKCGHTSDIKKRTSSHKRTYNENFNMLFAIENSSHYEVEKKFKNYNDLQSRKVKTYKGKEFSELFRIDENMTLKDVIQIMKSINTEVSQSVDLHLEQEKTKQMEIDKQKEQERTKQIEAQEKTKQLQLQIELEKIKIQQPLQPIPQVQSEQIPIPQPTPQVQSEQIPIPQPIQITNQVELTDEFKYSKVYLLEIMKSYPENPDNHGTGYNNYHGFSKDFKDQVEADIKTKFGLSPIKNNGKIYYIGLRFKNSTSFYNHDVYKEFLDKYVYIPEQSIRFKKIPPGMFMYKVELNTLYNHFTQFSTTKTSIYDIQNTILFKKEFIEMVVKICKVKYPSYTNKTVRYFNGICLK